jgi:hypothetical protein
LQIDKSIFDEIKKERERKGTLVKFSETEHSILIKNAKFLNTSKQALIYKAVKRAGLLEELSEPTSP